MDQNDHSTTLDIRYDMPASKWDSLFNIYQLMPGWEGCLADGCPVWRPDGPEGGEISASIEPSGLQFDASVAQPTFDRWIAEFMERATSAIGKPVRDANR